MEPGNLLAGQTALVTGAGRGIGRAISLAIGTAGATVILAARSRKQLAQTAQAIEAAGGNALVVPTDLSEPSAIKELIDVANNCGRLDILINNAGITFSGSLEQTADSDWDKLMAVNARGPFILCRDALALLRKSPSATIINIASVVAVKGYPNQIAYTASKHAIRGMSIAMAEELAKDNIRVHVICPGGVDTEMVTQVRPDIRKDQLIASQEIAELVMFLLTHKGNAVIDELRIRRAASGPWF